MSNWTPRTTRNGLEYGGEAHPYYWDPAYNPNASYANCLANCTTYTYGRILEAHQPKPVQYIVNAGGWHNYVNQEEGWTAVPFSSHEDKIKPGDILEWNGHVAVVEEVINGVPYLSSSDYTGDHGQAYWPPGSSNFDRRTAAVMGPSVQSVSNWMFANYPSRVFSYYSLEQLCNRMGSVPTYVLVNPATTPQDDSLPVWMLILLSKKRKKRLGGIRYL